MYRVLQLCLSFLNKNDLRNLSLVCHRLNDMARGEMKHRTMALAQKAYACIKKNPDILVMAGSMPLWLAMGGPTHWFPNDVDLFLYSGKRQLEHDFGNKFNNMFRSADNRCQVTFMHGIRPLVQVIRTDYGAIKFICSMHFSTLEKILKMFDITCCQVASSEWNKFTVGEHFATDYFFYSKHYYALDGRDFCKIYRASRKEHDRKPCNKIQKKRI